MSYQRQLAARLLTLVLLMLRREARYDQKYDMLVILNRICQVNST